MGSPDAYLAPALASACLAFAIHGVPWLGDRYDALKSAISEILDTPEHVETMRDYAVNASFLGPAVGIVFGVTSESTEAYVLAAVAFVAATSVAFGLSSLLVSINEREDTRTHRRMAGTVRSIVRSELDKQKAGAPGKDDFRIPLKEGAEDHILGRTT